MFFRRVALVLVLFWPALLPWAGHAQPGAEKALPMRAAPPPVIVVDVKGAIGVGTGHLIEEALSRARSERAGLVVLRLDTPGGLVSATRDMIGAILASPVPVAVFVSPSGARAASAGTYILYASMWPPWRRARTWRRHAGSDGRAARPDPAAAARR